MIRKLLSNVLTPLIVFVLPLLPSSTHLVHPGPWIGVLAFSIMLLSQPVLKRREALDQAAPDRGSALGIYAAMVIAQLIAVTDFGYGGGSVRSSSMLLGIGGCFVLAGLALRLWAIRTLGSLFTATVYVDEDQQVVREGPYRMLRHPSYAGALATAIGVATALGSMVAVTAIVSLVVPAYLYRIRVEESSMIKQLGSAYADYRRETWALVPAVY